ncbi:class I SAM-dependent methyltransferase [Chenggangzhangella methanolivorans]|uniref:SAM-dependent methyltransferase n=1 Tax=Chenggangzhangella methanolivorans TaxID=1437009 RepID=A0A9E6RH25_9HYPH|nr:SAM-dependent methyltransferase [Chenggangzhangella methanolivorans]QZO01326.1 SAM-dependent methyltransferase [Chenggangzhangella methanolivorans]
MTPLGREIAETIAAEGPMPVDRYMALCLSHPAYGYYATRDPFGRGGDFVTAPEISQMFGELIGLWAAEVWRQMGAPGRFALIELGPGRGTLMADMLRAAKAAPGFLEAAEIVLVETSPALREVQAKALSGRTTRWVQTVDDALGQTALPAIVVSNEFFDALPIRQFVRTGAGWRERLVGLNGEGRLAFGLSPAPADLPLPDAPEGSVREICPQALDVMTAVAIHLARHGGSMLAIDYGYAAGFGDTLQAMKAHAFADPFATPGEADLTAHVDFGALAAAARAAGAAPMRLIDQSDLMERLGLGLRAEALSRASPTGREQIFAAARRLTDRSPRGMGALFKAFAVCDPRLGAPPAFEPILNAET